MPLRPIDAIFVNTKRRIYVVYYRGELWQLPRMKIDNRSWQRRQLYEGIAGELYLSCHQKISDPTLAQKLRTLNLPKAIYGSTLPRFEIWWEAHGFDWLKDRLNTGQSPLAGHIKTGSTTTYTLPDTNRTSELSNDAEQKPLIMQTTATTDIFAAMLADLADEVLNQ